MSRKIVNGDIRETDFLNLNAEEQAAGAGLIADNMGSGDVSGGYGLSSGGWFDGWTTSGGSSYADNMARDVFNLGYTNTSDPSQGAQQKSELDKLLDGLSSLSPDWLTGSKAAPTSDKLSGVTANNKQNQKADAAAKKSAGSIADVLNNLVKGATNVFTASQKASNAAGKSATQGTSTTQQTQAGTTQNPNNPTKNTLLVPILIGGTVILGIGVILAVALKKK